MAKAIWNGAVLAESDAMEKADGNHYFPPDSLRREHFHASDHTTVCGYKGTASYYDVEVEGSTNKQAAWYYPTPKPGFERIKNYVGFWKGVKVEA